MEAVECSEIFPAWARAAKRRTRPMPSTSCTQIGPSPLGEGWGEWRDQNCPFSRLAPLLNRCLSNWARGDSFRHAHGSVTLDLWGNYGPNNRFVQASGLPRRCPPHSKIVLVVDDDRVIRTILSATLLEPDGFRVRHAANGTEATYQVMRQECPYLVIYRLAHVAVRMGFGFAVFCGEKLPHYVYVVLLTPGHKRDDILRSSAAVLVILIGYVARSMGSSFAGSCVKSGGRITLTVGS